MSPTPDPLQPLVALFRDNPPPEPAPAAWDAVLTRIRAALPRPGDSAPAPRFRLPGRAPRRLLGLVAAAAVVGGVLLARPAWQTPHAEAVAPFPVATSGEVSILGVDARDADHIVLGPPLIGSFDVAEPADVEILAVGPHPVAGRRARLAVSPVAMILSADDPK